MTNQYDGDLAERAAALWQQLATHEGEDADAQLIIERALRAEGSKLREAVLAVGMDMHQASMRPCPTCRPISEALHQPFGCYLYQAKRGQPTNFAT